MSDIPNVSEEKDAEIQNFSISDSQQNNPDTAITNSQPQSPQQNIKSNQQQTIKKVAKAYKINKIAEQKVQDGQHYQGDDQSYVIGEQLQSESYQSSSMQQQYKLNILKQLKQQSKGSLDQQKEQEKSYTIPTNQRLISQYMSPIPQIRQKQYKIVVLSPKNILQYNELQLSFKKDNDIYQEHDNNHNNPVKTLVQQLQTKQQTKWEKMIIQKDQVKEENQPNNIQIDISAQLKISIRQLNQNTIQNNVTDNHNKLQPRQIQIDAQVLEIQIDAKVQEIQINAKVQEIDAKAQEFKIQDSIQFRIDDIINQIIPQIDTQTANQIQHQIHTIQAFQSPRISQISTQAPIQPSFISMNSQLTTIADHHEVLHILPFEFSQSTTITTHLHSQEHHEESEVLRRNRTHPQVRIQEVEEQDRESKVNSSKKSNIKQESQPKNSTNQQIQNYLSKPSPNLGSSYINLKQNPSPPQQLQFYYTNTQVYTSECYNRPFSKSNKKAIIINPNDSNHLLNQRGQVVFRKARENDVCQSQVRVNTVYYRYQYQLARILSYFNLVEQKGQQTKTINRQSSANNQQGKIQHYQPIKGQRQTQKQICIDQHHHPQPQQIQDLQDYTFNPKQSSKTQIKKTLDNSYQNDNQGRFTFYNKEKNQQQKQKINQDIINTYVEQHHDVSVWMNSSGRKTKYQKLEIQNDQGFLIRSPLKQEKYQQNIVIKRQSMSQPAILNLKTSQELIQKQAHLQEYVSRATKQQRLNRTLQVDISQSQLIPIRKATRKPIHKSTKKKPTQNKQTKHSKQSIPINPTEPSKEKSQKCINQSIKSKVTFKDVDQDSQTSNMLKKPTLGSMFHYAIKQEKKSHKKCLVRVRRSGRIFSQSKVKKQTQELQQSLREQQNDQQNETDSRNQQNIGTKSKKSQKSQKQSQNKSHKTSHRLSVYDNRSVNRSKPRIQEEEIDIDWLKNHFNEVEVAEDTYMYQDYKAMTENDEQICRLLSAMQEKSILNSNKRQTKQVPNRIPDQTSQLNQGQISYNEPQTFVSPAIQVPVPAPCQQTLKSQRLFVFNQNKSLYRIPQNLPLTIESVIDPDINQRGIYALVRLSRASQFHYGARYAVTPITNLATARKIWVKEVLQRSRQLVPKGYQEEIGYIALNSQLKALVQKAKQHAISKAKQDIINKIN